MSAITPIRASQPLHIQRIGTGADRVVPFTDIFQNAIDSVRETDAENVHMQYLLATGQLDNPALATITATKAQLSVDLLVELRNRAIDAYNKLTQINL